MKRTELIQGLKDDTFAVEFDDRTKLDLLNEILKEAFPNDIPTTTNATGYIFYNATGEEFNNTIDFTKKQKVVKISDVVSDDVNEIEVTHEVVNYPQQGVFIPNSIIDEMDPKSLGKFIKQQRNA